MSKDIEAYQKEIIGLVGHITDLFLLQKIYKYVRYLYLK